VKPNIARIINKIKAGVKIDHTVRKINAAKPKLKFSKPGLKERDMRDEAKDMGSHMAREYFGGSDD